MPVSTLAAFCIDLIALKISGDASITPMMAPPISMPMPSGRYSSKRNGPGVSIVSPAASTGNISSAESIGDRNQ